MKLQRVHFASPVPLAGTHRREAMFDVEDGWAIDRDGRDVHIVGQGVDFWTDGVMSWVLAPPPPPAPYVPAANDVGSRKRGR